MHLALTLPTQTVNPAKHLHTLASQRFQTPDFNLPDKGDNVKGHES